MLQTVTNEQENKVEGTELKRACKTSAEINKDNLIAAQNSHKRSEQSQTNRRTKQRA